MPAVSHLRNLVAAVVPETLLQSIIELIGFSCQPDLAASAARAAADGAAEVAALVRTHPLRDDECFMRLVSRGLGLAIVVASALVKLPQIAKICGRGSSKGLSLASVMIEMMCAGVFSGYAMAIGSPFSAYGEAVLIYPQCFTLALLIVFFDNKTKETRGFSNKPKSKDSESTKQAALKPPAGTATVKTSSDTTTPEVVPSGSLAKMVWFGIIIFYTAVISYVSVYAKKETLGELYKWTSILGIIAKIPQIAVVAKDRSSGSLSGITVVAYFLGSVARVFTSYKDISDRSVLIQFAIAAFLNGVLLFLVLLFWDERKSSPYSISVKKKSQIKKKNE